MIRQAFAVFGTPPDALERPQLRALPITYAPITRSEELPALSAIREVNDSRRVIPQLRGAERE